MAVLLPQAGYQGLGVLRWEEWAPQWSRNQEKQGLYLEESRALLRAFFPDWSPEEVEKWSQVGGFPKRHHFFACNMKYASKSQPTVSH